jgi:hypothetical protein
VFLFGAAWAASSARTVAFSFIHTNDMPAFGVFPVSPLLKNALRPPRNQSALTISEGWVLVARPGLRGG